MIRVFNVRLEYAGQHKTDGCCIKQIANVNTSYKRDTVVFEVFGCDGKAY